MSDRLAHFTTSLREHARLLRLGPAPALLVHPNHTQPAPTLLWLHGRTVHKELDTARYLRLVRAGIAVMAIDLPGHGERADTQLQRPEGIGDLVGAGVDEFPALVEALQAHPCVDAERLAAGGMSAGGMIVLRGLCDAHPFRAACVEATAGDLSATGVERYQGAAEGGWSPHLHVGGWRPIPLLALHSEADQTVPVEGIRSFLKLLERQYRAREADPGQLELVTWPETGAPQEHQGFGRKAAEARAAVVAFLTRHLRPEGAP